MNANQLADQLKLDYTTVRHHMRILEENRLVVVTGRKYAVTYFISPELEANYQIFVEILEKLRKTEK